MQSPHKEDYIQTIMRLDERSQHALVVIVQNAIDERLADSSETAANTKLLEHLQEQSMHNCMLQQLTNENELLREELEHSTTLADKHRREAEGLRERLEEAEEQEYKQRRATNDNSSEQARQEIEQLRNMNDTLKQKLIQTVRENEEELARLREENIFLQNKMLRFKEY